MINKSKNNPIYKFPSDRIRTVNKETDLSSKEFLEKVGIWGSFYRLFPHLFVRDYLGINLKLFQCLLLYQMMHYSYVVYIATRGQGKTFLTAIFAVVRCILFPGTKVVASSSTKKQAMIIYSKIEDLIQLSPNLANEIESMSRANDKPIIRFKNGSTIEISASNENARGLRANVLILDERERMDEKIIDSVLSKFKANPRHPLFLNKKEYENYPREKNKEVTLSSAGLKLRPLYRVFMDNLKAMIENKSSVVCALPYQVSIKNGLLMKDAIERDMEKSSFDPTTFSMEMEALFYGLTTSGFFTINEFEKAQIEEFPLYPKWMYKLLDDKRFKYPEKVNGEIRILSLDVALSSHDSADDSIISVVRLIPNGNRYVRKPSFMLSYHGSHTEDLVLATKRTFYDTDCDYALVDYKSMGIPVYDLLGEMTDDKERNIVYPAWKSFNSEEHSQRCKEQSAQPIIYTMVATAKMNTDIAWRFKNDLQRGYIRIPVDQYVGREKLSELNGYHQLSLENQVMFESQYAQFDSLVMQTVNMGYTQNDATATITFHRGKNERKDRYSSISYANFLADILEQELSGIEDGGWDEYLFW